MKKPRANMPLKDKKTARRKNLQASKKTASKKTAPKKIAIVRGGPGPESAISLKSAQAVGAALKKLSLPFFFAEAGSGLPAALLREKPRAAFLATHGMYGEDGCPQAVCELLRIPYTGSGVLASALCMNKIFFKRWLQKNHIAAPDFWEIPKAPAAGACRAAANNFKYPVVVKASHGGSSLGTFIVKKPEGLARAVREARKTGPAVFIERHIRGGVEVAVSCLAGKILTPVEIVPKGGFYGCRQKYQKGQSQYFTPPRLDPMLTRKIMRQAQKAFQLAGVRGYARADFIVEGGKIPWLLELNTLPGLTETSLLPKSAAYEGLSFTQVIEKILSCAATDYTGFA